MRVGLRKLLALVLVSLLLASFAGCRHSSVAVRGNPPIGLAIAHTATPKLADKVGFIDEEGNTVVPARYDRVEGFREGLAFVSSEYLGSYIDRNGEEKIKTGVGNASFSNGYARGGSGWYIDKHGKVTISQLDPAPAYANDFSDGIAAVGYPTSHDSQDFIWGYINTRGRLVIKPKFGDASPFSGGLALVCDRKGWEFIDTTGRTVSRLVAEAFPEGDLVGERLKAGRGQGSHYRCGYVARTGRWVIRPRFDDGRDFSEGRAAVMVGDLWGFVDTAGRWVTRPRFESVGNFSDGMAAVEVRERFGFIDAQGKMVIPPIFCKAYGFSGGRALVFVGDQSNGDYGYINKAGKVVIAPPASRWAKSHDMTLDVYPYCFSQGRAPFQITRMETAEEASNRAQAEANTYTPKDEDEFDH